MSNENDMIETCFHDGKMSPLFLHKASNDNYDVYGLCSFTGIEVKLDEPEYRNHVTYKVKWRGGE